MLNHPKLTFELLPVLLAHQPSLLPPPHQQRQIPRQRSNAFHKINCMTFGATDLPAPVYPTQTVVAEGVPADDEEAGDVGVLVEMVFTGLAVHPFVIIIFELWGIG